MTVLLSHLVNFAEEKHCMYKSLYCKTYMYVNRHIYMYVNRHIFVKYVYIRYFMLKS